MNERIERFIAHNEHEIQMIGNAGYATRKELAGYVTTTVCPACLFCVIDGKSKSVRDYVKAMPTDMIIKYLNKLAETFSGHIVDVKSTSQQALTTSCVSVSKR
jgi:ribosomal protein S17E